MSLKTLKIITITNSHLLSSFGPLWEYWCKMNKRPCCSMFDAPDIHPYWAPLEHRLLECCQDSRLPAATRDTHSWAIILFNLCCHCGKPLTGRAAQKKWMSEWKRIARPCPSLLIIFFFCPFVTAIDFVFHVSLFFLSLFCFKTRLLFCLLDVLGKCCPRCNFMSKSRLFFFVCKG